jgi:hypothetical protein
MATQFHCGNKGTKKRGIAVTGTDIESEIVLPASGNDFKY